MHNPNTATSSRPAQQGVVLIEALVAILIFSVGVLAIVGLQANMIQNTADAKFRSEAGYIAKARIGQIWANPTNLASFVETDTDISGMGLPNGKRTTAQVTPGEFRITVTWLPPGPDQTTRNYTTTARVAGF